MADTPQDAEKPTTPTGDSTIPTSETKRSRKAAHEITFITYPKLLFIWPIIVLGFVLYPLAYPETPAAAATAPAVTTQAAPATTAPAAAPVSRRLEIIGWVYIWVAVFVLLTLGVDVERNMAVFWVLLVVAIYILGMWLHDVKGFTLFGDIYRWFGALDVQYDRKFGLALSILLAVPYIVMLLWARINDRWRITHNEFEHYTFGKMNDSLGRGAKTIRTDFPDVFELILGLAGTLIVYNSTGTKELRRIPHVMFLPFVRRRLNQILETTSITAAATEDEENGEEG